MGISVKNIVTRVLLGKVGVTIQRWGAILGNRSKRLGNTALTINVPLNLTLTLILSSSSFTVLFASA